MTHDIIPEVQQRRITRNDLVRDIGEEVANALESALETNVNAALERIPGTTKTITRNSLDYFTINTQRLAIR